MKKNWFGTKMHSKLPYKVYRAIHFPSSFSWEPPSYCGYHTVPFLVVIEALEYKIWLENATPQNFCHGVFIHRFIFRSNFPRMRLLWECHDQSLETNWCHCVTGPELPFFHKRKSILKIDQSVKMPWHRLSTRVAWTNAEMIIGTGSPVVYQTRQQPVYTRATKSFSPFIVQNRTFWPTKYKFKIKI